MVKNLKVKKLRKLPRRKENKAKDYDQLYVIASGKKHDLSDYALMYIIGINGDEMEIAASCEDICWDMTEVKKYSFRTDMIYPSGILHHWSNDFKFRVGHSIGSTDVALVKK